MNLFHCTTSAYFFPDLHAGNILLCLSKSIDNLTVNLFYEKYHRHVDTLGKLPPDRWNRWNSRGKWFDEQGERRYGQSRRPCEERFEHSVQEPRRDCGMEEVSKEEKAALIALLKPRSAALERTTAEEILESKWMNKWALQDLGDM